MKISADWSSYIEAAMARVPPLANAGVHRVINGPIPYSPDGNPYIGPEHGLRNFFHCAAVLVRHRQAGGAGKTLAEWVVDGGPEWDLWSFDPPPLHRLRDDKTYTAPRRSKSIRTNTRRPIRTRSARRPAAEERRHYTSG